MAPTAPDRKGQPYRVLVTGFGPFGSYETNPSWLAVAPLDDTTLSLSATVSSRSTPSINLSSLLVPVTYASVLSEIPPCHHQGKKKEYDLFVHVGVSPFPGIHLETVARKTGYRSPDADKQPPPRSTGSSGGGLGKGYEEFEEVLRTSVDVEGIVTALREKGVPKDIRVSKDAGLFLCEFIFYASLAESQRSRSSNSPHAKVLFVHVPPEDDQASIDHATSVIQEVIQAICWGIA